MLSAEDTSRQRADLTFLLICGAFISGSLLIAIDSSGSTLFALDLI